MELSEDKHEHESKHEELAGNFSGFKIYTIWKDNTAFFPLFKINLIS